MPGGYCGRAGGTAVSYIMDTPREGDRIELKTDRRLTLEQLCWAGIKPGDRVLDMGCAAGTTSRMIGELVGPGGRVVGIDASRERIDQGMAHPEQIQSIEYRQGDACLLPAADAEFDVSWSRFLFEYLNRPREALAELIRVTRPGGTVCVSDLDGNCIWHHPCSGALRSGLTEALRTLGDSFNPHAGKQLYTLFYEAGLRDIEVDIRPYHSIIGTISRREHAHWQMKLEGVATALRRRGWSESKAAALVYAFSEHLRDPETMTYSVIFTVKGVRA